MTESTTRARPSAPPATNALGAVLFPTPVGACGVAWSSRGLVAVELPEATDEATLARLRTAAKLPDPARPAPAPVPVQPPAWVRDAIARMTSLLAGGEDDLVSIPLDLAHLPPFYRKVYELTRRIRRGETQSYGEIAAAVGSPGGARAVGQALAKNPLPVVVPCHRVLAANGKLNGFSSAGGIDTKARLLAIEGARYAGAETAPAFAAG